MKARFTIHNCEGSTCLRYGIWKPVHIGSNYVMRCLPCGHTWNVEDEKEGELPVSHFAGERNKITWI